MITLRKTHCSELSQNLVHACCALARAQFLLASLAGYSDDAYALAWDVAPHLADAEATVRNLVTVHDLTHWQPFWSRPADTVVGKPCGTFAAVHNHPGGMLIALHNDLAAAYGPLILAEAQAADLSQTDPTYSVYGSIGWDLPTAVDDVLIKVRAAAAAAGLATHPYWDNKP